MKRFPTPARGLLLACTLSLPLALMSTVRADTLKLKDGTTLEGVATDAPGGINFQWRPSPSVKDEKFFKTSEIAELKRLSPDELEFPNLKKLVPTPDLLGATAYTKIIEGQIKPFLTKYPASKLVDEVKAILKTYEEELEKINNGWQKLEGAWISPEENKWNEYNITARSLRKEMEDEIKKKDTKAALDKMIKIKSDYIATPAFVAAIEMYSTMLDDYDKELLRQIAEHPAKMKELAERKGTLEKQGADELQLAIDKRKSDLKLKVEDEKKRKVPIFSSDEYDLPSLKFSQQSVAKERVIVQALIRQKDKYAEAADLVGRALEHSGKGNAQMAYTLMEQALKLDVLKNDAKLKAKKDGFKDAANEALKNAPKPILSTPGLPPKGDPAPPKTTAEKTAAEKKAAEKKAPVIAKKPTGEEAAPLEEEDNTLMYVMGGAGALVLAGAGFAFLKKRKKDDDDD